MCVLSPYIKKYVKLSAISRYFKIVCFEVSGADDMR